MMATALTEQELERGRVLFAGSCEFIRGVTEPDHLLPPDIPEVAFAGRSNVGKSSLINALTGRKSLARASNTPGRTQQLNFFNLGGRLMLVDLPGYGFAKASRSDAEVWNDLVLYYLTNRSALRAVCLLVDSRHGFKDSDIETMKMFTHAGVPYIVVLTKADKMKLSDKEARQNEVDDILKKSVAAFPQAFMTSSGTGEGISFLRGRLATYAVEN